MKYNIMEMDITTFNMQRPRAAKVLWQPGVLSMSSGDKRDPTTGKIIENWEQKIVK